MLDFFSGKRVLVTGHTGFKGMWLCKLLELAGAQVSGYALKPVNRKAQEVLMQSGVLGQMHSVIGDIRDLEALKKVFVEEAPEIVLHLAEYRYYNMDQVIAAALERAGQEMK